MLVKKTVKLIGLVAIYGEATVEVDESKDIYQQLKEQLVDTSCHWYHPNSKIRWTYEDETGTHGLLPHSMEKSIHSVEIDTIKPETRFLKS